VCLFDSWQVKEIVFSTKRLDQRWCRSSSQLNGSSGIKRMGREIHQSPLSITEVNYEWSYITTPFYSSMSFTRTTLSLLSILSDSLTLVLPIPKNYLLRELRIISHKIWRLFCGKNFPKFWNTSRYWTALILVLNNSRAYIPACVIQKRMEIIWCGLV
jgi:hypothetical protein